jgi:hypothetical protein
VNNPGIFDPLKQLGTRLRERLLSDPDDGLDQLLIWLTLDGLFLWQFVGLMEPTDPLFQRIGDALRAQTDSENISAPLSARPRRTVSGMKAGRRE